MFKALIGKDAETGLTGGRVAVKEYLSLSLPKMTDELFRTGEWAETHLISKCGEKLYEKEYGVTSCIREMHK